jgi:hypothetical protein
MAVNASGALIFLGGAWALAFPLILWWALKAKRYMVALVASLPIAWFGVGYLFTL